MRGTLPISRKDSLRYGGATSCVSLALPDGRLFIFDGGSGIRALSDALLAAKRTRLDGKILISHPHWDHINALPFFAPFYVQGNRFEICGASHGDTTIRDLLSAQMDGVYFPVTIHEFAADMTYRDLSEGEFDIGGIPVKAMLLSHPGNCLGYRITYGGRSICYVTDNELYDADSPQRSEEYVEHLIEFTRDTDALVTDCTYTDEVYPRKTGWGHSSVSQVAELARRARVKNLYLVHHDPDDNDDIIDAKLARSRELLAQSGSATSVVAPASAWRSRSPLRKADSPPALRRAQRQGSPRARPRPRIWTFCAACGFPACHTSRRVAARAPPPTPTRRRTPTGVTTRSTTSLSATAIS